MPELRSTRDVDLQRVRLTVELSDGPAGVTLDALKCPKESPTRLTCAEDWGLEVVVAESVDLTAGPPISISAGPGASIAPRPTVRNAGDKPVTGLAMRFVADWAFESITRFRNCRYDGDRLRSCTFDQTLEPGASFQVVLPQRVRADSFAPATFFGAPQWLTAADLAAFHDKQASWGIDPGTSGDGEVLTLTEAMTARQVPQTDETPEDNWGRVELSNTGRNGANLVALGADLTGAAGDEVALAVGVRNDGPAAVDMHGSPAAVTAVYPPAGATVLTVPDACQLLADKGKYQCYFNSVLKPGATEVYEFGLRIDTVIPDARGKVAVNEPCRCPRFADDLDMADNAALITVNKTSGSGTGGGESDDPTLPITGPAGLTLAGAGLALLVAGAAGFVLSRRRTTFLS